jgi:excisionase family DNA binding protein
MQGMWRNKTMAINLPESVRESIRRQATERPQVLLAEDRDVFLATVEPEHRVEAELALNERVDVQEQAVRDWRDQVLLRILAVSESLLHGGANVSVNPHRPVAEDWLETEQAAVYLNLTPKTVREGAVKGTLPGHKYPLNSRRGRWRFKRVELDSWLSRKPRVRPTKGVTAW